MKTVSTHVEDYMMEYPFLSKFLRQGILNYKALARQIEPEISKLKGEKVSVGAIAVSLQRLKQRDQDKLYSLIGRLRGVKVVTGVKVLQSSPDVPFYELVARAAQSSKEFEDPFMLSIGNMLFVEKMVASVIAKEKIDTASYTALIVTREITHVTEFGGLSYPLQVLAEHGVLVKAVSATFSEETIIVDEAAADKAASVLRHALWR